MSAAILNRYLYKAVSTSTLLVLLVICGLELLITFLDELDEMSAHGYGVKQACIYVLSSLPSIVYPLFPAIALMGGLVGLGRLASRSELIVMQASGMSKLQITRAVMTAMIMLLLGVTLVGEGLGPQLKHKAEHYKMAAQTGSAPQALDIKEYEGLWIRDGHSFVYIENALPNHVLTSIWRYEFVPEASCDPQKECSQAQLRSISFAKTGTYQAGHWVFSDIQRSVLLPNQVKAIQHIAHEIWPIALNPDFVGVARIHHEEASLIQLYRYIVYLHKTGLYAKAYEFELFKRLLQPLAALIMVGLAIPFVFGSLRTRTMGFRILVGILIGFCFYLFNEFIGPFSLLYQIPPFWAAVGPLLLFIGVDILLLIG